jgi:hypothetical protein
MSIVMFGIGFLIFVIYVIFLVWNIVYNGNKQQEENYPTISSINDAIDMDGIGNQGRVPIIKTKKRSRKKIKRKVG